MNEANGFMGEEDDQEEIKENGNDLNDLQIADRPTEFAKSPAAGIETKKLDPAFVKDLWFYLKPEELLPNDELLEKECYALALELRQELENALSANDNTMADLMKKFPNAQYESDQSIF